MSIFDFCKNNKNAVFLYYDITNIRKRKDLSRWLFRNIASLTKLL
jgi:hypothetical protein